ERGDNLDLALRMPHGRQRAGCRTSACYSARQSFPAGDVVKPLTPCSSLGQLVSLCGAGYDAYPAGARPLTVTAWSTRINHVPAGNTTLRMPVRHLWSASRYAARNMRT